MLLEHWVETHLNSEVYEVSEVFNFYLSMLGIIALIVGVGSIIFYPKQTLEAVNVALGAVDKAMRRWAES